MYVIDIETKPAFLAGVLDYEKWVKDNNDQSAYQEFEFEEFREWLNFHCIKNSTRPEEMFVMHNFEGFDKHILNEIMVNPECTVERLMEITSQIIDEKVKLKCWWNFNITIDTIKYVDKSLKDYAIEHDLPMMKFDFNAENFDAELYSTYLKYDVYATAHLYKNYVVGELANRFMAYSVAGFDINFKNICSNYLSSLILVNELINNEIQDGTYVDCNYDYDYEDFKHIPQFNHAFKDLTWGQYKDKNGNIKDGYLRDGKREIVITWKNNEFVLGLGGLHSANLQNEWVNNLYYLDISSYYPNLIIWLLENHPIIRKTITKVYEDIVKYRVELKHAGKVKEANSLKLFINALYGLLYANGYETKIHNPLLQAMVCVTGQYEIMRIFDIMEDYGMNYEIVQANTDGLMVQTKDYDKLLEVKRVWEESRNNQFVFDLEEVEYMYQSDVNNYFWQYKNGKIKAKGKYKINYDVNTKFTEIRHNIAINKIFINHKLGKEVLKIEEKDYRITPNNNNKEKYGAVPLYLNRNGKFYLNINSDNLHMFDSRLPVFVTDNAKDIDHDYYVAMALGGNVLTDNRYEEVANGIKELYECEIEYKAHQKNNIDKKLGQLDPRDIKVGGFGIRKDRSILIIDFDIDSEEQFDEIPEVFKNIYNLNATSSYAIDNNTGERISLRKKLIFKIDPKVKPIKINIPHIEIFHNNKTPKIYGDKEYNVDYFVEIGSKEIPEEYLNELVKFSNAHKKLQALNKKNKEESGIEYCKGEYAFGYCSEGERHRGLPFFDCETGALVDYACLHTSCLNYKGEPHEHIPNSQVYSVDTSSDNVDSEYSDSGSDTSVDSGDVNSNGNLGRRIKDLTVPLSDLEYEIEEIVKKANITKDDIEKEPALKGEKIPKLKAKAMKEQLIIDFISEHIERRNSVFDRESYIDIIKEVQLISDLDKDFAKFCWYFENYSKNTDLRWWQDDITIPQVDGFDKKTNKFVKVMWNLANSDLRTFEQLEFLMYSIFNENANRNESVFIFNGSGGNGKGLLTTLIDAIMKPYETPLIKIMRPGDVKILKEGKTGAKSSNCVITRINEISQTNVLNDILKNWYEPQVVRVMRENYDEEFVRLSIPILISNHDFTMYGTEAVKRRQVRIKFTGTLDMLKKQNNPLWQKDPENNRVEFDNIKEDFINDFWQYATWLKDQKIKRPAMSQEDIVSADPNAAIIEDIKKMTLEEINELKIDNMLDDHFTNMLGHNITPLKLTKLIKSTLGLNVKRVRIGEKRYTIFDKD